MDTFRNGAPATNLPTNLAWAKSSRSGPNGGNCVEFAKLPDGSVGVRNSRDPEGSALVFSDTEIKAMLEAAKDGEFDNLIA